MARNHVHVANLSIVPVTSKSLILWLRQPHLGHSGLWTWVIRIPIQRTTTPFLLQVQHVVAEVMQHSTSSKVHLFMNMQLIKYNRTFDPTNKEAVRGYLDMYFNSFEHKDWPLLHRATTMFDWQQGSINADLLKIICASGLRSVCVEHRPSLEQDLVLAVRWAREVQDNLLKRFENLKIPDLQALVLIIRLRFTSLASQGISMLLSLASRMVFAKRLNYEVPEADPVKQEGLRRLMWAVYDLDKIYCGGIEDLTLCPTHRMHIRLPNNDSCFQRGLKSRSSFLKEPAADEETYMDSLAYRMRLLDIRDRILR